MPRPASSEALAERPQYRHRERRSAPGTWSQERIVEALLDWNSLVGRSPRSYEWGVHPGHGAARSLGSRVWARLYPRFPSSATVVRRFGRWSPALKAAGLAPTRAVVVSGHDRGERIERARVLVASGLTGAEVARLLEVSPRTVRNYLRADHCPECGDWIVSGTRCGSCAARHARPPAHTREEVLAAIRRWIDEVGSPPRRDDWNPTATATKWGREYPRWPSQVTVSTLFGSWGAALEAAGLPPHQPRWSSAEIAAALAKWAAERGEPPRRAQLIYGEAGLPTGRTVYSHFGSYAAALEAAGLEPRRRRRARTDARRRRREASWSRS